MAIVEFPPVDVADETGLLALGGDLEPESLLLAYSQGIFPWPMEGIPLAWFSPPERAVLDFCDLKISKSLQKAVKKILPELKQTHNQAFNEVIELCAEAKERKNATWITGEMKEAYIDFHRLGHAHSFEIWREKKLIGGIYGVLVNNVFSAESMFHLESYASQFALLKLVDYLKSKEIQWMDIQQLTPHLEKMGAKEIPREEFLSRFPKNSLNKNPS